MKKILSVACVLVMLVLVMTGCGSKKKLVKDGYLTMATNAYFPPYEYYEGDKVVGIDPMLAKAICDKLGYELEILDCEFDVIINNVDSGKADFGMAGMTITEKRLESVNFSDPYTTSTQVIIVRNK